MHPVIIALLKINAKATSQEVSTLEIRDFVKKQFVFHKSPVAGCKDRNVVLEAVFNEFQSREHYLALGVKTAIAISDIVTDYVTETKQKDSWFSPFIGPSSHGLHTWPEAKKTSSENEKPKEPSTTGPDHSPLEYAQHQLKADFNDLSTSMYALWRNFGGPASQYLFIKSELESLQEKISKNMQMLNDHAKTVSNGKGV